MSTLGGSSISASIRPANGGFFGTILSDIQEGLGRVATDVLPNWVAREMGAQTADQLRKDLYNEDPDRPRVDKDQAIRQGTLFPAGFLESSIFEIGTFSVTGNTLLVLVLVVVGAIVAVKVMK